MAGNSLRARPARRAAALLVLWAAVASVAADALTMKNVTASSARKAGYSVSPCAGTPINQVACKLNPDTNAVLGLWFGAWGANAPARAAGRQNYIPGEVSGSNTHWYTNNYCQAWGLRGRCVNAAATSKETSNVAGWAPNGFIGGAQMLTFATRMRVYYNAKGSLVRVEWDTQQYNVSRVAAPGNPPEVASTAVTGTSGTASCGQSEDNATRVVQYVAPEGTVLGAFEASCKYGQGWGKYKDGTYKVKYWLGSVAGACATYPVPYPTARFPVPTGANPNDNSSPFFNEYTCGSQPVTP